MDPNMAPFLVAGLVVGVPLFFYLLGGFYVVQPRTQVVAMRYGKHVNTITSGGVHYMFPLGRKLFRVTSSVVAIDLPKMMVLEWSGTPIEVSGVCSYRVREAHLAVLGFEDFNRHVSHLATAVMKNVCSQYPYDSPDPSKPCLRKETGVVTAHLVRELQELVNHAGIEVLQIRINDLTYAPEIAQSMLLRQQAAAMVDARRTIVEGAVETVVGALNRMRDTGLSAGKENPESFASNLMLVLCSGERVQTVMPITIETGDRT